MVGDRATRNRWRQEFFAHPEHGPLPALLSCLTVVTGMVDAVSVLSLGRVFVANMTGNVVFIGFGLAGAPGFSVLASLIALLGFAVGAGSGGLAIAGNSGSRGRLLLIGSGLEVVLLELSGVLLLMLHTPHPLVAADASVATAAVALGLQNAVARHLAVPDFTTTVLTMALTGLFADLRRRDALAAARRAASVVAMLIGALIGTVLVRHRLPAQAMLFSGGVTAVIGMVVLVLAKRASAENPMFA